MESSVPSAGSGGDLREGKIATKHHPEGIDPDQMFFHEIQVRDLILEYQRDGKPETWQKIVLACLPLIDSLIRKFNFQIYEEVAALRNECILKLFKAIRHYNPDRGRAFTVLTIAFTRFLISYVQTLRTRSRRFSLVADEILEQYEGPGQGRTELPEELKTKIQAIRTRFKSASERGALKLLINYFLLEGFSQPRKLVLETVRRQFALSLEKADTLYDYALVSLRSVLHEFYTPAYSPAEMLRLCRGSTLLAEIHGIIGEQCFARLLDIFAGVTASFPSKAALEKMRKSREFLNRLGDEKQAFPPSSLANPQGQMMFDPNGRISFMVTRADLPKFASNNRQAGTPEENKTVVQGSLAYFGTYSVSEKDNTVTVHIESCSFPNWNGIDQTRSYTISGDELKWSAPTTTLGSGTALDVFKRAK